MPVQELHADVLVEPAGEACAIGAMLVERRISAGCLARRPSRNAPRWTRMRPRQYGVEGGMPHLVAWAVAVENDEYPANETPTDRYTRVLRWVRGEFA